MQRERNRERAERRVMLIKLVVIQTKTIDNKEGLSLSARKHTHKAKQNEMSPTTDTSVVVVPPNSPPGRVEAISISLPPSVPATVRKVCEQFLSARGRSTVDTKERRHV